MPHNARHGHPMGFIYETLPGQFPKNSLPERVFERVYWHVLPGQHGKIARCGVVSLRLCLVDRSNCVSSNNVTSTRGVEKLTYALVNGAYMSSSLFRSVFRLRELAVGQPDGAGERSRGAKAVGGT